jgi:hypothetical protein
MNMFDSQKILRVVGLPSIVMLGSITLTGCATSRLMMRYGELETQTELSESVFLELRSDLPRTVYVVEASTIKHELTILPSLREHLMESGYTPVETPEEATYLVQINHRELAEYELGRDESVRDAVHAAFAVGAGAGLAADVLGASGKFARGVGLAAGVVGFIADAKTKHIAHTLTTDVLLTETVPGHGRETDLRYHETRIVSGASKVNLRLEESLPAIVRGLCTSVSGLLPPIGR